MSAPMVVIVLRLEESPVVHMDAVTDEQAARLDDWLRTHPEYDELVTRACALADIQRAA